MARKEASKHSRAARRGQVDTFDSSESKELASLPRLEKTDTVTPLIRASLSKNQQLLNDKLNRKNEVKLKPGDHVITANLNKKKQHMISKTIRSKIHRFQNFDGRLGKKVENALKRKQKISNLRKTGWDKINEIAKQSLTNEIVAKMNSETKTNVDIENEMLDDMKDEEEIIEEIQSQQKNPFELLGEEE